MSAHLELIDANEALKAEMAKPYVAPPLRDLSLVRVNGRGRASRLKHRARRIDVKQSAAYRARRDWFPKFFEASPAPASAGDEASAVMGATPLLEKP